jgi:hypothetical protein
MKTIATTDTNIVIKTLSRASNYIFYAGGSFTTSTGNNGIIF